jgi:hypothetical protein
LGNVVAENTRAELVELFQLFGLTPEEAAIAANGPGALRTTVTSDELGEIFEPIGRGGYREF